MHSWHVFKTFDEASMAAADFLASRIAQYIQQNNVCHIALPGGNTPAACLSYLVAKDLAWKQVHWYLGDERCYPVDHQDRNDVMLYKNLWSHIPDTVIHIIPAELGAEQAAEKYAEEISVIKNLDIVFLGMGEDGHTASLFPGNPALDDDRAVVPVYDSPKAPDSRVSLSVDTLKKASLRMVLASGAGKCEVIQRIRAGEQLPVNMLGDVHWYIDSDAAGDWSGY